MNFAAKMGGLTTTTGPGDVAVPMPDTSGPVAVTGAVAVIGFVPTLPPTVGATVMGVTAIGRVTVVLVSRVARLFF